MACTETPRAQDSGYCVVGSTVTITGTIARAAQRPDGKEWAFIIRDQKSEPCKADAIILTDSAKPAACQPGRVVTGTGKVHLFSPSNPNSQIIKAESVKCR